MNINLRLALVAALLGLAACTGTQELPNPVLLVTGYQTPAQGGRVALIRDSLNPNPDRLDFLQNSDRSLLAPPVGYDIVNRERARSSLVVLSRSTSFGPRGGRGYIETFSLNGIDPANPVNFAKQAQTETSLILFEIVPPELQNPDGDPSKELPFCPTKIQVTQGGDYAAVLNVPSLCGLTLLPFIDILDLRGARLLERFDGVSSSGLYLSQSATQDLLYYATPEAGSLRLRRAILPRPGQLFGPNDTIETEAVVAVPLPAGEPDAVDLQRAGTGTDERLVFLFRDSLYNVTGFGIGGTAEAGDPTETPPDSARVIRDDARTTEGTLLLSLPRTGVFSLVPPLVEDTTDLETSRVRAVDAVVERTQNLIYFVIGSEALEQNVALFDLSAFDTGGSFPNPTPFAVPELTLPSFVTWAQAVPQASAP